MNADRQAEEANRAQTIHRICDMAWQAVYGEGRSDWAYPDMAIRHLIAAYREAQEQVRGLRRIARSAYATPEWLLRHRTEETDQVVEIGQDGMQEGGYNEFVLDPDKEGQAAGRQRGPGKEHTRTGMDSGGKEPGKAADRMAARRTGAEGTGSTKTGG